MLLLPANRSKFFGKDGYSRLIGAMRLDVKIVS